MVRAHLSSESFQHLVLNTRTLKAVPDKLIYCLLGQFPPPLNAAFSKEQPPSSPPHRPKLKLYFSGKDLIYVWPYWIHMLEHNSRILMHYIAFQCLFSTVKFLNCMLWTNIPITTEIWETEVWCASFMICHQGVFPVNTLVLLHAIMVVWRNCETALGIKHIEIMLQTKSLLEKKGRRIFLLLFEARRVTIRQQAIEHSD